MFNINFLIFAPFILSLLIPFSGLKFRNIIVIGFISFLAFFTINNFLLDSTTSCNLPSFAHYIFICLDILLLLYFLSQGVKKKDKLVSIFAITQIVLYGIVLTIISDSNGIDMISDKLSGVMYLIINIVGGLIIIYALEYIESENFTRLKKNSFIAILLFFIGVMNFIVTTNSIEVFFLLFEITTLCSYLLIGYRGDEKAIENSLRALWMNQIGGVAILIALIFSITSYDTVYFSTLLSSIDDTFLLPIAFLIIAAYVKGAAFPFHNWLLGAMVAPTPVSAILHSATMVKIAPYLILKISVAFTPFISGIVSLFGAFVFFTASIMALNKDFFKEILGLSTVALLSLMICLAAIGTPQSSTAAMILIVFHAISKAMLFLQAGVLEKLYHLKYVSQIDGLINIAPKTLFFIIIGFASLTLPPFGAFISKFMAIETITAQISSNPLNILVLVFLILGSVILTLLYFKVVSKLFTIELFKNFKKEVLPFKYFITSTLLFIMLLIGIIAIFDIGILTNYEIFIPTILIFITPFIFYFFNIKNAIRVKEYNCGEKDEFEVSSYYFNINEKYLKMIMIISFIFIALTIIGGF